MKPEVVHASDELVAQIQYESPPNWEVHLWDGYENGPACQVGTGYSDRDIESVTCLVCLRLRIKYLESLV